MKTIVLTIKVKVTEESYDQETSEMRELKKEIESGQFQRNLINKEKGIMDVRATFEIEKE